MEIPELLKQWIGALVRWALTGALGYLVAKGIITADMSAATIIAITGALTTLAWSMWQKWHDLNKPKPEGGL